MLEVMVWPYGRQCRSATFFRQLATLLAATAYALFLHPIAQAAEPEKVFHVGVTAFRDKAITVQEWEPTMAYLSSQLPGTRFVVHPMHLPEFEQALKNKELDFVITNPEHYIIMEVRHGVSRVATLVKSEGGNLVNRFGGVILTRNDRNDIRTLQDVKGKTIAAVDHTSFAAYLLQYDLLKENGVDLDKDARVTFLGFPQDLSVTAVMEGRADVGFVRSGVLEAMAREGKISLAQIRVISGSSPPDFPFLLSTALYPEWPFAAAPHVPFEVTNQVAAALLLMPPDSLAAKKARYHRWATPVEYQSVQNLMRRHRIYPFDAPEKITARDVFYQYSSYIFLITAALALTLAILYIRSRRLNIALQRSRKQLSELALHDTLTGLPNRNLLDRDLERAIAQSERTGTELAVCMIDLDGFKPINDKWGHKVGDRVLQEVANRLSGVLRVGDTVARWGGDEFVLLLTGNGTRSHLSEIVERVLASVARRLDCCDAQVTASVGVCIYGATEATAEETLKRADEAMYRAKKNGGNQFSVWSPEPENPPSSQPATPRVRTEVHL